MYVCMYLCMYVCADVCHLPMAQLQSAEELLLVSELPGVEIFRHQRFSFLNQLQVDDLNMVDVYGIHVYVWRYIYIFLPLKSSSQRRIGSILPVAGAAPC